MAANPLSYYEQIAKTQFPKLSTAEQKAKALAAYKSDPQSDYSGKRENNTTSNQQLNPMPKGTRTDWGSFLDGKLIYVPAGTDTNGVYTEGYITLPQTDAKQPVVHYILKPSADGRGFELQDVDSAAAEFLSYIPKNDSSYLNIKQKLQQYYPGGINGAAYKKSLTQPIGESDLGFMQAIKNSLDNVSSINWT